MIIKIAGLSDGINFLEFEGQVNELKLDEPFRDNYSLKLNLDKSHHQLILSASLTLGASFSCDRCGVEFSEPVTADFKLVYLFGVTPEDTPDTELLYLPFDADKINIAKEVYDFALLSLPMKKLCKEDCAGLCPRCHANLNTGQCVCTEAEVKPQWEALQELKNKIINK